MHQRTHRLAAALIGGYALLPPGRKTTPLAYEPLNAVGEAWARRLGILEGA